MNFICFVSCFENPRLNRLQEESRHRAIDMSQPWKSNNDFSRIFNASCMKLLMALNLRLDVMALSREAVALTSEAAMDFEVIWIH